MKWFKNFFSSRVKEYDGPEPSYIDRESADKAFEEIIKLLEEKYNIKKPYPEVPQVTPRGYWKIVAENSNKYYDRDILNIKKAVDEIFLSDAINNY